jgi:hypothetical protein
MRIYAYFKKLLFLVSEKLFDFSFQIPCCFSVGEFMLVLSKLLFLASNELPRLVLATTYVLVLSKLFSLVRQSLLDILFQAMSCSKQEFFSSLPGILDFAV